MESLVRPAAATKGQSEIVCRRLSGLGLHRGFAQKNFRTAARGKLRAMECAARLYPAAPASLSQSPISGLRCKAGGDKVLPPHSKARDQRFVSDGGSRARAPTIKHLPPWLFRAHSGGA